MWGLPLTAPEVRPAVPAWVARGAGSPPRGPCAHFGEPTGGSVVCPTCAGGKVRLKLFSCAVYQLCTPGKPAPGVACCVGCPSYAARA